MTDTFSPKYLASFATVGTFAPDELVIEQGESGLRTIASGAGVVLRGTVLGKITASGKLTPAVAAANDGSQIPYAIMAENVDATSVDVSGVVFFSGKFNTNFLIFGAGHSAATVFDAFRAVDIELATGMPY